MKPEIVPTAPSKLRQRAQQAMVMPRRLGWLILSVMLSLAAGIISTLFMLTVPTNWPVVQQWLDRRQSETVIVSNLESTATAEVVELLQQRATQAVVPLYAAETFAGMGTAVTSDGWFMTTPNVVGEQPTLNMKDNKDKIITSDRMVHDPYSNVSFIHFPLTDLALVDFRQSPVLLGDGVIVVGQDPTTQQEIVSVAHIQNITQPLTPELSITTNNVSYVVDRPITGLSAGSPVFDYEGKILGLYLQDNLIMPLRTVEYRMLAFLESNKFKQPKSTLIYTLTHAGAVVNKTNIPDLDPDDIIIEVNDQLVSASNDLSWLLAEHDTTTADVMFLRDGKRHTARVTID